MVVKLTINEPNTRVYAVCTLGMIEKKTDIPKFRLSKLVYDDISMLYTRLEWIKSMAPNEYIFQNRFSPQLAQTHKISIICIYLAFLGNLQLWIHMMTKRKKKQTKLIVVDCHIYPSNFDWKFEFQIQPKMEMNLSIYFKLITFLIK